MDALALTCGVAGFVLGALAGVVAGVLCTVKAFLVMHQNSLPRKG